MKEPQDCENLDQIRAAIDTIDREIIRLLSRRGEYVAAATEFKRDRESVRDEARVEALLKDRRIMAEESGCDPDLVEDIYKKIVSLFVKKEMALFKTRKQ